MIYIKKLIIALSCYCILATLAMAQIELVGKFKHNEIVDFRDKFVTKNAIISPDGKSIITSGDSYSLIQWDIVTGQKKKVFEKAQYFIKSMAYSVDGTKIVAGGNSVLNYYVWNAHTGNLLTTCKINDYLGTSIKPISFTPDGNNVVYQIVSIPLYQGGLFISDWKTCMTERIDGQAEKLIYSDDGRTLLALNATSVYVYNLMSKQILHSLMTPEKGVLGVSRDGSNIVYRELNSTNEYTNIDIYNLNNSIFERKQLPISFRSIHLSTTTDDVSYAFTYKNAGFRIIKPLLLFDLKKGEILADLSSYLGNTYKKDSIKFSRYGNYILAINTDEEVELYDFSELTSSVQYQNMK